MSASASDVSSAVPTVMASAWKNVPGDAGDRNQRQKHDDRRDRRTDQRHADLGDRAADRVRAALAGVAVHHDVLDDDDRVVDHEADRGREAAERHQVEALAHHAQRDEGDRERRRNHQAGDERRAPVAQEQHHDERRQHEADQHGVAHARDRIVDEVRLVVERLQIDALRQLLADRLDLGVDRVRDRDGVAVRLTEDVQEHGRLARWR